MYQLATFNACVVYNTETNQMYCWVVDYPSLDDPSIDMPGYESIDLDTNEFNTYLQGNGPTDIYTWLNSVIAQDNPISSGSGNGGGS